MTIKEVEKASGLTRANIRFYEAEGLLTPKRLGNRYREYSESDLETLRRVKLLRNLRISLEEIKALHSGEKTLDSALCQHLETLQKEDTEIERSVEVCQIMLGEGAQYQTLDAQRYFTVLEQKGYHPPAPDPEPYTEPKVYEILRRFFARGIDIAFYQILWSVFLTSVLNKNLGFRTTPQVFIDIFVPILLMLLFEPILLHLFGTTVGKALLGLRVRDHQGRKLTYGSAFYRTLTVLVLGMGLNFPLFNLYRLWRSFVDASERKPLEWELASQVIRRKRRWWHIPAYIGACAVLIGALFLSVSMAQMPKYRGDITVSQFSENVNRLFHYNHDALGFEVPYSLDQEGRWTENANPSWSFFGEIYPELEYSVTDGVMTGLRFTVQGDGERLPLCGITRVLFIQSLIGAQDWQVQYPEEVKALVELIEAHPEQSFTYNTDGFTVTWEVRYCGYSDIPSSGVLWSEEGEEHSYYLFFSMEKLP